MTKKVYGQKNVTSTNLADYTEIQAKDKGKIFYLAWADYQVTRKEKNRNKLKKALDKRLKK